MTTLPLACSVRDCGLPIERRDRVFVCPRGHAYDLARRGYLNLLQPQDRRSLAAGDTKEAVEARARLLAAGIGRAIVNGFVHRAAALALAEGASVVDLGSGSGEVLGALVGLRSISGIGIDLSTAAAEHAARRFPDVTWVVANADRRLPLVDRTIALVLSLHARRNPAECARVLRPDGRLLVAVPAKDDLVELRAVVQGEGVERERTEALLAEHEPFFTPLEQFSLRVRQTVKRDALMHLLQGTYRAGRTSAAEKVKALTNLEVTLASDVFLFAPR